MKSIREQFAEFKSKKAAKEVGTIQTFLGVDADVYNCSIPFSQGSKTVMAARVEKRDKEISDTMFFEKVGEDTWQLIKDAPIIPNLQDPFMSFINGKLVVGGVYTDWDWPRLLLYRTDFYMGDDIYSLKKVAEGPPFMKDVRVCDLGDGRILVLSRPQGERCVKYNCIAKIGCGIINDMSELTPDFIEGLENLEGIFADDEWGGPNHIYPLDSDTVGVIGHKSWGETVDDVYVIHYYSISFKLNITSRKVSDMQVIACRDNFPEGPQKNPRAYDVAFTAGVIRNADKTATLYSGLSDCQVGKIVIADPFV